MGLLLRRYLPYQTYYYLRPNIIIESKTVLVYVLGQSRDSYCLNIASQYCRRAWCARENLLDYHCIYAWVCRFPGSVRQV